MASPVRKGAEVAIPLQVSSRLAEARTPTEDWTGTTSAKERRKLQNRLNQRARRRRQTLDSTNEHDIQPRNDDDDADGSVSQCQLGKEDVRSELLRLADERRRQYHAATYNLAHLPFVIRFNVFDAFTRNAYILGFGISWLTYDAISPLRDDGSAPDLPQSLQPTRAQRTIRHHPWIDFFPCPRLRDNILTSMAQDGDDFEDELCSHVIDATTGDEGNERSALIAWGDSWEPAGWEVTEVFLQKWPGLLRGCDELMLATNRWRRRRGLPVIRFDGD